MKLEITRKEQSALVLVGTYNQVEKISCLL